MDKALSFEIRGIKCDACDFMDKNIEVEDYKNWLNKPCPKCGANLLTQADFDNVQFLIKTTNLINEIYPKPKKDEKMFTMSVNMDGSGKMDFNIINEPE